MSGFIESAYKFKVKPKLDLLKKMMEEGKGHKDIEAALDITQYEWKFIKKNYSDVVAVMEEVMGKRSEYWTKVEPRIDELQVWIYEGLTFHEICKKLDILPSTLKNYLKIYPDFESSWKEAEMLANSRVEGAVFKRAIGYSFEERKEMIEEGEQLYDKEGEPIYLKDQNGDFILKNGKKVPKRKPGKVKVEKITKHMAPDPTSASFWLTNKDSENWSNRRTNEVEFDPKEAARIIRDTIGSMEETVPRIDDAGAFEDIVDKLSFVNKEDLEKIKNVVDGMLTVKR